MPRFEAELQSLGAGAAVEIPFNVKEAFGRARAPVQATVNGHRFRSTVAVYGGKYYLGFNREVREAAGVAPGETITVDLEPDAEERTIEVPPELAAALEREEPDLRTFFDSLSFTHRKEYVRWIHEAKREETRQRRVERAVEMLRERIRTPG